MKITTIKTQNFIGARDVDVKITKPICLFAGKNASGKSSLQEAVRMSLTGESVRVSLKKDYGRLIAEGQTVGYAVVEHDGQQSAITLPNGSHEHTGNDRLPAVLPYVLDAQRFSSLPANERRAFLFGLMGLRTDGDTVGTRMLDKGCDPIKVDEIRPHLRAGFDAAHKEAQSKARDAKAAWRATTGETYGSVKAATWRANKPEFSADRLRLDREEFHRLCEQADEGARTLGDMQGRARTQAAQSAKLAGLRERAGRFARIDAKLQKDVAELAEWQAKVEHEARKGGKQMPVEPTYTCPACSAKLRHDHANGALVEFTPPPIVSTCEPGKLAEYQKARDLLARSVENDKRDLADADSAAKMLAELDTQDAPAPAPEEIEAARVKVEATKKQRAALQEAIRLLEADEKAAAQAEGRTVAALGHHADVAQWEEIAGALAPNGIPGEMLGEALEPINDRLAKSANETEWLRVGIESDMTIDAAGRPYALLSESERWRVDAMIAEAISHLSGVKLLVLDRVDVLDFVGREDLLYWLDGLAADGEIDSALLFATLKALPASLPENIEAIWIENGIAGKVMAAA
ncbi:MAG: recombinase RecF [Candidatus Accumulibacter sp.]|uniref:AAA family ATPase n=1 Tax=Accumulibacter sp. TaxID=2053492 RepID=UPI00258CF037|nr:AAA family ATPase [Accumulibacter sp.]MBK8113455.1 recombinase RecF [Accumulibacter sp.]